MAAIAVAPAAPPAAPPALSEEQLKQRFLQFSAATGSVASINEINQIFNSVTSDSSGLEWLRNALSDQSFQESAAHVQNFVIGEDFKLVVPAEVSLIYHSDKVFLRMSAAGEIQAKAEGTFYGGFDSKQASSAGDLEYKLKNELLSSVKATLQVSPAQCTIVFYDYAGTNVGTYKGSGVTGRPADDTRPISWK